LANVDVGALLGQYSCGCLCPARAREPVSLWHGRSALLKIEELLRLKKVVVQLEVHCRAGVELRADIATGAALPAPTV